MFDLKPNCKHCGVNIMYYTQEEGLIRDAKRTELESASARMVVARVKAAFIGGKLQVFRMIAVLVAVAALLVPFFTTHYTLPFFDEKFSVGILGVIFGFMNGLIMKVPAFLGSKLLSAHTVAALVPAGFFIVLVLIDAAMFVILLCSFLNLTKTAKLMCRLSLVGAGISAAAQIAALVMKLTVKDAPYASVTMGFGALAAAAVFVIEFLINRQLLKNGIEPTYRENDIKRKELLTKLRAGEISLDDLPLPVLESEEEHAERMRALEEALKAEEEGKEL